MKIKALHIITLLFVLDSCSSSKVYLFSSFHEPANAGLRMLYSYDACHWTDLDTVLLKPTVGKEKIMRDPSILQGPDAVFRLVWTTEWKGGNGFGYASSKDLIHWSEEQYIPVMKNEPGVVNVWAPELFYDDERKEYIIVWASTIPFRFEKGIEDENNNHRLYYVTTKDFSSFSETKLFFDPKFSAIDAMIVKMGTGKYALVLKDNTRPQRNIKVAFADHALGPYSNPSAAFTEMYTEGPTVARAKDWWIIYYDAYQKKKYGAVRTKDFKTFEKADSLVSIPGLHKHGTIFMTDKKTLNRLKALKK